MTTFLPFPKSFRENEEIFLRRDQDFIDMSKVLDYNRRQAYWAIVDAQHHIIAHI